VLLIYLTYLIIPHIAGSLEPAFLFLEIKRSYCSSSVIIHLLLQQPLITKSYFVQKNRTSCRRTWKLWYNWRN